MDIPSRDIIHANSEWDEEITKFLHLMKNSSGFLSSLVNRLDMETRENLHELLDKPIPSFALSAMSPSKWDCPIQQTSLFKKIKSPSQPNSPQHSPKSSRYDAIVNVIIPSLSVDKEELQKIDGIVHYEERQLYNLLSLKDQKVHIIYVTAIPLHPSIVNYYISFIEEFCPRASERLTFFSTFDASVNKTLTEKILERPRLQAKIRRTIEKLGDNILKNMICFIPTDKEHELSKALNIPLEASPEDVQHWGSKCGSRQIFKECNIPLPNGIYESIWSEDELITILYNFWEENPKVKRLMVKLNEGFSGEGNALLDFRPLKTFKQSISDNISDYERKNLIEKEIKKALSNIRLQSENDTWETFRERIVDIGCIIEEYIEGKNKKSPSVQGIINDDGSIDILSSHEQILGGSDGQVYLGCHFPCDINYRLRLHDYTKLVGESLAKKGAKGRYGVDFLAVPLEFDEYDLYTLEINLRHGGTTHPYETLHLLTGGEYSEEEGVYVSSRGEEKYYIASDNLRKEEYCGLLPSDLMTIIGNHDLLFDEDTHKGVVFHLMGALSQYGKVGVTCIANSIEEAQKIYDEVVAVLDKETKH